jgi:hypothetical protein
MIIIFVWKIIISNSDQAKHLKGSENTLNVKLVWRNYKRMTVILLEWKQTWGKQRRKGKWGVTLRLQLASIKIRVIKYFKFHAKIDIFLMISVISLNKLATWFLHMSRMWGGALFWSVNERNTQIWMDSSGWICYNHQVGAGLSQC